MGFLKKLFGGAEPPADPVEQQSAQNLTIRQAVEQVSAHPSDQTRGALYRRLNDERLLVAVQSLPEVLGPMPQTLTQETHVTMLTSTGPEGGTVLLAFTDEAALNQRAPGRPYLGMPARDVLDLVLRNNYAGLVINPGGPWAGVPRAHVQRIVDGEFA
ncbi:MAG: SseB family protein [Chloroflexi bacterium]|nr:SseB family protein [Chloroflexota bacterium]